MKREGLFKAIKYCGSQQALANALGVTQPYVNHLLNRDPVIPDFYVIKILILTKGTIPLEELSHNPAKIRRLLESGIFFDKFPTIALSINDIKVDNIQCTIHRDNQSSLFYIQDNFLSRPILVDAENCLITCPCRIRINLLLKNRILGVHQIYWPDVISEKKSISDLIEKLPISERVMVAISIEKYLGNRRGRRNHLKFSDNYPELRIENNVSQLPVGVETRVIAAKIAGFSSDFMYRQAKFVIECGVSALIWAMDEQHFTVSRAKDIAKLSAEQQQVTLNSTISNNQYLINSRNL